MLPQAWQRGTGDPEAAINQKRAVCLVAHLWVIRRRGRQKFRRSSEDLVTPQAFADPRLAFAWKESPCVSLAAASEGSPVLREPA